MKIIKTKKKFKAYCTENFEGGTVFKVGSHMGSVDIKTGKFIGATVCMVELGVILRNYKQNIVYQLLSNELLLGDAETPSKLYVKWNNKVVKYITTDLDGGNIQFFKSTKHPEKLSDAERYRVLEYCLGKNFDRDEIVNYNDLFLQMEFIKTTKPVKNYELSEKWLNY